MRLLALPRDRNPYQEALYAEMRRQGVPVSYLGELTPSRTLNLVLLPAELALRRAGGARVVHLHWVFGFALPGSRRAPVLRRVAQWWFGAWLRVVKRLGMTLVWTAHNAAPHQRVFHDDTAARRALVRASDLVIAHSPATLEALEGLDAQPARSVVIPIGTSRPAGALAARPPRAPDGTTRLLFVGRVLPYKGVEDLLGALRDVPRESRISLEVVGECPDPALRSRLASLAAASPHPVTLSLAHVPDERLDELLAGADAVVLPFRRVTTSSSAILALDHGRPLIVPALPGLRDLPEAAVVRYDGTRHGLVGAIGRMADAAPEERARLCAAARSHSTPGWQEIAALTIDAIGSLAAPAGAAAAGAGLATGIGGRP